MTPKRWAAAVGLLAMILFVTPAKAITNGIPDEGAHPYVGQLLFYVPDDTDSRFDDPGVWYNCSGTLISPTVVLTAGHCTYGVGKNGTSTIEGGDGSGGNDIWVNFSEVPTYEGFPPSTDYIPDRNQQRYEDRVEWLAEHPVWIQGTAHVHPQFDPDLFFLHDLGVVVLDRPVQVSTYGALPEEHHLESFRLTPRSSPRFTDVGYGLEKVLPIAQIGGDTRRKADVMLITLKGTFGVPYGVAAVFSNNKGAVHRGGTCFGDSGGPVFVKGTNVIVAITSFGLSPNCTGADGAYRVDQADDLEWLAEAFGITG